MIHYNINSTTCNCMVCDETLIPEQVTSHSCASYLKKRIEVLEAKVNKLLSESDYAS